MKKLFAIAALITTSFLLNACQSNSDMKHGMMNNDGMQHEEKMMNDDGMKHEEKMMNDTMMKKDMKSDNMKMEGKAMKKGMM